MGVCVCADLSARMLSAPVALTPACSGKGPLFQTRSRLARCLGRLVTLGGMSDQAWRGWLVCEAGRPLPCDAACLQVACAVEVFSGGKRVTLQDTYVQRNPPVGLPVGGAGYGRLAAYAGDCVVLLCSHTGHVLVPCVVCGGGGPLATNDMLWTNSAAAASQPCLECPPPPEAMQLLLFEEEACIFV